MSTDSDRRDRSDLDAKTDTGPGVGHGATAYAPEDADFDREIDVRSIVWSGVALTVVTLVAAVIVWLLLRGIGSYDDRRDVPLSPIEAANPQQPPPEPRLEVSSSELLNRVREEEDLVLNHADWVNPQQGIVRVPIDVAIDVIAARGAAPAPPPQQ
ncbi:MAG TPA: hypothetical protein VKK31_18865 [Thermoanaerobaculia bacterium]|nr:hypothetical protein [Thermoanaerobaculia bacterium]